MGLSDRDMKKHLQVAACLNSPCCVCEKKNPGMIDASVSKWGVGKNRADGWKVLVTKDGGVRMVCSDKCLESADFAHQLRHGLKMHKATVES